VYKHDEVKKLISQCGSFVWGMKICINAPREGGGEPGFIRNKCAVKNMHSFSR